MAKELRKGGLTVNRLDKKTEITVPEDNVDSEEEVLTDPQDPRESIIIRAKLVEIGSQMGFKIWIPKGDRGSVLKSCTHFPEGALLENLPLGYDPTTMKTIENIDILWLRGHSIAKAFEVEHTTSIYSGILRMADLLALQPNINIKLHIVAPVSRREKVFEEIKRPVFSILESGAMSDFCTYLSYDSIKELSNEKHLNHLSDTVLDDYVELAE